LSISRQLAHLLGGELLVESVVGQGSRFSLVVPQHHVPRPESADATPAVAATTPTVVPAMPARRAQARPPAPSAPAVLDDRGSLARPDRLLLIVEDDPAFASILYDLAHELEFDGVVASTTDEGFRLATELRPTGILLDVSLPDGSGLALLDRLKRTRSTRHIPVHMMSVDDHTQTALALGAVGYAVKPATRETLLESVRRIEAQTQRSVRRLLIVEDDEALRSSMVALLQLEGVELHDVGTGREALQRLSDTTYDCVVLDLSLPDASGFDVLDAMSASQTHAFPPVIIYTGRALSAADEERLRRYSRSVIVKGARSPERLLDEVTLFLHRVESTLPTASQRMLRAALERDEIFEGRRILLAEDDVRNIFALSAVLEPRGATMVIARNGREAVDLARAERPDLVLMDIMMPEMDGLAATRAIRAEPALRDVPIIALTAKARREDREQCLEAGANDYMAKPIDVDKLVSLCRVWMAR
jgi:CheY-like chemotaxis protein